MAKFRQGNLILTASESIINGAVTIDEFSTDVTLSGDSDTAIPTERAIKTYIDTKIAGSIGSGSNNAIARYDSTSNIQTSGIFIDDSENITSINSITLNLGTDINEFSTDGTLIGNSDDALPTEQAVKTYVDGKIAGSIASSTDNALARYDGTDGIQGSGIEIDDSDNMSIPGSVEITGTTKIDGHFYAGTDSPDATTRVNFDGYFYATKTFNAVWNDYADFQKVNDKIVPGMCYYDTFEGAKICNKYCQKSVIGIVSDTYGHAVGGPLDKYDKYAPFAISGWVLAYIDEDAGALECGDILTSSKSGKLTKMSRDFAKAYPERVVATYKRPETGKYFGPCAGPKVEVKGRHWVKVK